MGMSAHWYSTVNWDKRPDPKTGYDSFSGNKSNDPARKLWGEKWSTPTWQQMNELMENTTFIWTNEYDGGVWVKSKINGNRIYLPAAGGCLGTNQLYDYATIVGEYWTSTPSSRDTEDSYPEVRGFAYYLSFRENTPDTKKEYPIITTEPRRAALNIRPVFNE